MTLTRKQRIAAIIAGVALVLLAFTIPKLLLSRNDTGRGGAGGDGQREQRMRVRMEVVHPEKFGDRVNTVGTILANEEVEIRSEIPGKVERIYFREGAAVRRGDPLLKIHDADLQAQLLRAQSRLSIASQTAERQQRLFEKQLISQEAHTTATNELNIAKAELQLIQAQIDKATIRAPFEGTIGLRNVSEGSYISPSTVITTLQDKTPIKLDFRIPEKHVGHVRVGDNVTFRVEGLEEPFQARIYSVDSRIDQSTRTLRVRAVGPNPRGLLIPGALAAVETEVRERDALSVPSYALIPDLKGHTVLLARGGRAVSQPVTIGTRTETRVEILSGLQAGDTLITSGILQVRPGTAVAAAPAQQEGPGKGEENGAQ